MAGPALAGLLTAAAGFFGATTVLGFGSLGLLLATALVLTVPSVRRN